MIIKDIKILNFRNHLNFEQSFSNSVNLILGENSAGKTSIIEAIYFLANTKSFRTSNDRKLTRNSSGGFYLKGCFKDSFEHISEISFDSNIKTIKYDNERIKKIREYIARISIVLYNPLNLYIINEGPVYRREFVNIILSKTDTEYYISLRSYLKLLSEKRAALKMYKERKVKYEMVELINNRLAAFAAEIIYKRNNFLKKFRELAVEKFNSVMARQSRLNIEYRTSCVDLKIQNDSACSLSELTDQTRKNFVKMLGSEIKYGRIMTGPQCDDFSIIEGKTPVKDYYSQGERKTLTLAFKLAEIYYIRELTGGFPIVLLDDIFSELDERRRRYLINELNKGFQAIITDTDYNERLGNFPDFQKIEIIRSN